VSEPRCDSSREYEKHQIGCASYAHSRDVSDREPVDRQGTLRESQQLIWGKSSLLLVMRRAAEARLLSCEGQFFVVREQQANCGVRFVIAMSSP